MALTMRPERRKRSPRGSTTSTRGTAMAGSAAAASSLPPPLADLGAGENPRRELLDGHLPAASPPPAPVGGGGGGSASGGESTSGDEAGGGGHDEERWGVGFGDIIGGWMKNDAVKRVRPWFPRREDGW
uniref:Uncharacterized protein n=1 Tax=Oryza brachyantha TaxID=4533 RepID=J3N9S5_ORYBR